MRLPSVIELVAKFSVVKLAVVEVSVVRLAELAVREFMPVKMPELKFQLPVRFWSVIVLVPRSIV